MRMGYKNQHKKRTKTDWRATKHDKTNVTIREWKTKMMRIPFQALISLACYSQKIQIYHFNMQSFKISNSCGTLIAIIHWIKIFSLQKITWLLYLHNSWRHTLITHRMNMNMIYSVYSFVFPWRRWLTRRTSIF